MRYCDIVHVIGLIAFAMFLILAAVVSQEAFWYAAGAGLSAAVFAYSDIFRQ